MKHEIIRHDYYIAYNNDKWPQWVCKCGGSDHVSTGVYTSIVKAQEEARQAGQAHVVNANKAEEMLAATNGNFAF